jgi:hypothetical protein
MPGVGGGLLGPAAAALLCDCAHSLPGWVVPTAVRAASLSTWLASCWCPCYGLLAPLGAAVVEYGEGTPAAALLPAF